MNQHSNKTLCKNTDCIAEKNDEYDEPCNICDGYYKDDGLNDILFIQEEPNNAEAICCNLCEKTDNIIQMKDTGEYICGNACDEEEEDLVDILNKNDEKFSENDTNDKVNTLYDFVKEIVKEAQRE